MPGFTNYRQIGRRVYFDYLATGHAEVFAEPACRQPDDFVRIGDLRQLEVKLVDELCVEFGPLGFGDVNDQSAHFQALPIFIINGLAVPFHPAHAPVRPDNSILVAEISLLLNRLSHLLVCDRQVIRMHPVGPGLIVRLKAEGGEAHDRVSLLGRLDGVGSRVPLPDPHASGFEREPQTFFAVAQRLYRLRPSVGRPEAGGSVADQLLLVRAPIPRSRVINTQIGFPLLFVQGGYGDECADPERLVFGGEIAHSRIVHHVFDDSGSPGHELIEALRRDKITHAVLAYYARTGDTPTVPAFTNERQTRRRGYFDNVAASHAEVFAKPACRQPDDFVRIGDLRQLEVKLVDELRVEFGLLGFGDVNDRADIAEELSLRTEARLGGITRPAILAVITPQAVFEPERLALLICGEESLFRKLAVIRLEGGDPAKPEAGFRSLAGEFVPRLAQIGASAIRLGHPHHHRSVVGHVAETRLAFTQRILRLLALGELSDLAANAGHHLEQAFIRLSDVAAEKHHNAESLIAKERRKTNSVVQACSSGQRCAWETTTGDISNPDGLAAFPDAAG